MKRWIRNFAVWTSFVLAVAVCVLAFRARNGSDYVTWSYDRYLPDDSVATTYIHLVSDHDRIGLDVGWGHVEPFNGQLVWGYHVNADESGGQPKLTYGHRPDDALTQWFRSRNEASWFAFPLSFETGHRTAETNGDDSTSIRFGVSHWLLALLLFVPPLARLYRWRRTIGIRQAPLAMGNA